MVPGVRWFPVPLAAMVSGQNQLTLRLIEADPQASDDVVIDEVEIWVQPK